MTNQIAFEKYCVQAGDFNYVVKQHELKTLIVFLLKTYKQDDIMCYGMNRELIRNFF